MSKLISAICRLTIGTFVVGGLAGRAQEKPALAVCDVLVRSREFNHKVIAVRGIQVAAEEGTWLTGVNCTKPLITMGYQWPSIIWLELRASIRKAAGFDPEPLRTNSRLIRAMIEKQRRDVERDRVWLTYLGRFETYDDLESHVLRDSAGARGIGFGHLNSAPAMLIVNDVQDLRVERVLDPKPHK